MSRKHVLLGASLALLAGCSPVTAGNMSEGVRPAALPGYPQRYDVVFEAVTGTLTMLRWQIDAADLHSGVIEATAWGDLNAREAVTIHVFHADTVHGDALVHVGVRAIGASGDRLDRPHVASFYHQLDLALQPHDSSRVLSKSTP